MNQRTPRRPFDAHACPNADAILKCYQYTSKVTKCTKLICVAHAEARHPGATVCAEAVACFVASVVALVEERYAVYFAVLQVAGAEPVAVLAPAVADVEQFYSAEAYFESADAVVLEPVDAA